jgi:organic radical activating enzyme
MLSLTRLENGRPEIFCSLQGEGVNSGIPTAFLRLAFCNLNCNWCDTKYSWDWEHFDQDNVVIKTPLPEIEARLHALGIRHLVVTGGEPLIQQKTLKELLIYLSKKGYYIEIETNGTIQPDGDLLSLVNLWSVSPKLENSGNICSVREFPEVYGLFARLSSSYFKYVIQTESDLDEVQSLVSRYNIAVEKIILMPEGTERETILARGKWLAGLCSNRGYRFCTRLHIILWGNKRGI